MKRTLNMIIVLCLICFTASAQMSSIHTKKEDALFDKFKTFIVVDENTGFAMAQKPVQYDPGNEMPLCYFTLFLPDGLTSLIPGKPRLFVLHTLQTVAGSEDHDWVLEDNFDEKDIFFARNKFIINNFSKQWQIMVDGEEVVFKNIRTRDFLYIDENGDYKAVPSFAEATRWKLIYIF